MWPLRNVPAGLLRPTMGRSAGLTCNRVRNENKETVFLIISSNHKTITEGLPMALALHGAPQTWVKFAETIHETPEWLVY